VLVEELRAELEGVAQEGEDPETFWELGERHGYEVRVGWGSGSGERFDVQLRDRHSGAQWPERRTGPERMSGLERRSARSGVRRAWASYGSDPPGECGRSGWRVNFAST
jgi:hypothetical protein